MKHMVPSIMNIKYYMKILSTKFSSTHQSLMPRTLHILYGDYIALSYTVMCVGKKISLSINSHECIITTDNSTVL